MKTKEEILMPLATKVHGEYVVTISMAYKAMDAYATQQVEAATANHDKEIADFCEWVTTQHGMYPHSWQIMLNKFRQSK